MGQTKMFIIVIIVISCCKKGWKIMNESWALHRTESGVRMDTAGSRWHHQGKMAAPMSVTFLLDFCILLQEVKMWWPSCFRSTMRKSGFPIRSYIQHKSGCDQARRMYKCLKTASTPLMSLKRVCVLMFRDERELARLLGKNLTAHVLYLFLYLFLFPF